MASLAVRDAVTLESGMWPHERRTGFREMTGDDWGDWGDGDAEGLG